MKLKQLLEQLNQLAKERPEALEMEVIINRYDGIKGWYDKLLEKDVTILQSPVVDDFGNIYQKCILIE